MFDQKDEEFLSHYQALSCNEDSKDAAKTANIQRKCLGQAFQISKQVLDNWSTCTLLENQLKKYSKTVQDGNSNIYNNLLKEKMNKIGLKGVLDLKCGLNNVDIKSMLAPLNCDGGSKEEFTCGISEDFMAASEYLDFLAINKLDSAQKSVVNTSSQFSNQSYPRSNSFDGRNITRKVETESGKSQQNNFKTAHEELQIQNMKKYGNSASQNQLPSIAQKRKLGTRRNINSKFVSPLLSNNGSEELAIKSEEWVGDVDERLKNIEPKMIELIRSEIMDSGPTIDWEDIAGLDFAKTAIQEAVVWPLLRPDIFTGLRRPPKGILLFGPPGTGKTLIGKCVASQSKSTFFSISASSLTSKWVGDGEKMVRALFAVARCHQPAVIFIDEIDSLLSQRSDTEHESSRRIKTEFLVQLDGATTESEERLLVIGATNRPQELDEAARRRFVKRLYIPLPELKARLQLVRKLISTEKHFLTDEHFMEVANLTEGYSGADIRTLCAEASLGPIRSLDFNSIEKIQVTEVRPLMMEDFQKALTRVRSSVSPKDLDQYLVWDNTYGSGSGF